MPKYLIEIQHDPEELACARIVHLFLTTGSHFLSQADWGCMDGAHTAWIVVEVDNKEEARNILPPAFRAQAKIIALNKFSLESIEQVLKKHQTKQN